MLRVTSRLIALLQRIEPQARSQSTAIAVSEPAAPSAVETVIGQSEETGQTSGWQKIVVRYAEGQLLKGYTQDFSPGRSQFSIWPSVNAASQERVIVPLARLKGVFFVRDFAGNPGYVERVDADQAQHGRRIEVTLVDDEVIVGRTLSYRPDGYGFFVFPPIPRQQHPHLHRLGCRQAGSISSVTEWLCRIRDPGSGGRGPGSGVADPGDSGSGIGDLGFGIRFGGSKDSRIRGIRDSGSVIQ